MLGAKTANNGGYQLDGIATLSSDFYVSPSTLLSTMQPPPTPMYKNIVAIVKATHTSKCPGLCV